MHMISGLSRSTVSILGSFADTQDSFADIQGSFANEQGTYLDLSVSFANVMCMMSSFLLRMYRSHTDARNLWSLAQHCKYTGLFCRYTGLFCETQTDALLSRTAL